MVHSVGQSIVLYKGHDCEKSCDGDRNSDIKGSRDYNAAQYKDFSNRRLLIG